MQKEEQSSRPIVICYLMIIMRIDVEEANQLVAEMEKEGLIKFDESGNISLLILEGKDETDYC